MRHKYLFITITLTFLFALNRPVFAQYPNWKNYTDGGYVYDICRQGNLMWIGTLGGLVRVNTLTNETTYFDKTNSGLPDNRVTSIAVDSSGKLWVGTYYGIGVYDGTNWIKYDTGNSILPVCGIWELYISPQNDIWIGTFYGHILRIKNSNWTLFEDIHDNTPFGTMISSIVTDQDDNIWVGVSTTPILGKFDGNSWSLIPLCDYCFVQDINVQGDSIWLTTYGGLIKIKDDSLITVDYSDWGLMDFDITKTFIDRDNNFWVTSAGGLTCIKPDGSRMYYNDTNSGILCNVISDIEQDTNGKLWVGTSGRGVAVLDSSGWYHPNISPSGLGTPTIFNMCFDKNGTLWGTVNPMNFDCLVSEQTQVISYNPSSNTWNRYTEGIYNISPILIGSDNNKYVVANDSIMQFNDSVWSAIHYMTMDGFPSNSVSLYAVIDTNDNIYVARYPGRLQKYSNGIWSSFLAQTILNNGAVQDFVPWGMCCDKYNNIWMLCNYDYWTTTQYVYMDLVKYDGQNFTNFHLPLSNGSVAVAVAIAADKDGNIWIGCMGGLLLKFDGTTFTTVWPAGQYSGIEHIDVDNDNNLWISTESGLYEYSISDNVQTLYNYTNSGLPGTPTFAVVFDQSGSKWIATSCYGLAVFNEDSVFNPPPPQDTSTGLGNKAPVIFPNPAQEQLSFDLSSFTASEAITIILSDIMGTVIKSVQVYADANVHSIDISDLEPGIYFLVFCSSSGKKTSKIVIL